jgi:hypothetical protein
MTISELRHGPTTKHIRRDAEGRVSALHVKRMAAVLVWMKSR